MRAEIPDLMSDSLFFMPVTNVALSVETTLRILEMPKDISAPKITFHFQSPFRLAQRTSIRELLIRLAIMEKKQIESLTYVFCDDEYLLQINRQYLKHDFYTDIITFDLGTGKGKPIVGEIYISIDRVRENAKTHAVSLQVELLRVIFHGALHLCGYKDKTRNESAAMRKAEELYLALFGKMFHVKHLQ
jgi:probable rRNA maturation factor